MSTSHLEHASLASPLRRRSQFRRGAASLFIVVCLLLLPTLSWAYGLPLQPLSIQLRQTGEVVGLVAESEGLTLPHEFPLAEVRWTVGKDNTLANQASLWGLPVSRLRTLNPERGEHVTAGQRLLVYRFNPFEKTRSVGKANAGRLVNGVPFPEGDAWELRESRRNHWGTRLAIRTLHDALRAYAIRFPDGPKLRVGDYSTRTGGRLRPHKSHRSGRDVDFNYFMRPGLEGERRWGRVTEENFDAQKTWFLLRVMLESGNVESMFVDRFVQKLLAEEARKSMSDEEVLAIFEHSYAGTNHSAPLQHWPGHRDHAHVRFRCERGDSACR